MTSHMQNMSFQADIGPSKVNQTGELNRNEFYSIDDEVQTGVHRTSLICILIKVE